MTYPQGAVVVASDPFGGSSQRPYVVISNTTIPFPDQECIAVAITTAQRNRSIELTNGHFVAGRLPRQSFISPWNPLTLKLVMIEKQIARVSPAVVRETVVELTNYLEVNESL